MEQHVWKSRTFSFVSFFFIGWRGKGTYLSGGSEESFSLVISYVRVHSLRTLFEVLGFWIVTKRPLMKNVS